MVVAVEAVLVAQVLHVEMDLHQLQLHLQAALESVIQLQELQRITAAEVVHLGMAAQLVGLARAVSAAVGKEQTEISQLLVQMDLQTPEAAVVLVMSQQVAMVDPELSLFVMEFQLDFLQLFSMLTTELDQKQPIFQL
jgi:hypothetical protein